MHISEPFDPQILAVLLSAPISEADTPEDLFITEPTEGGCRVTGLSVPTADVNIPAVIRGQRVVAISSKAFALNPWLRSVRLPEGICVVPSGCFLSCENLTRVTLPEGLTTIAPSAFCGCEALQEINIPATVTRLAYSAFEECSADHLHDLFEQLKERKLLPPGYPFRIVSAESMLSSASPQPASTVQFPDDEEINWL